MEFPVQPRTKPNPNYRPQRSLTPASRIPPYWIFLLALGLISYLIYNYSGYEEVVTTDSNGNPILTPERKAEIARRQKKNDEEAEQYVLRAIAPGYRECYLCPEGKVWLEAEEIAKIGVSTDGEDRYSLKFYEKHGIYYDMEYRGSLTIAKNREIARLGSYPLLPENQKREHKLLYPPLNTKLD
ncbi:MAG: hypothetical protein KDD06_11210 [Phaeodactylibacter sp.]|nr:hypothetical protein [Phaeodactylibacter sp.]MCB9265999.1 hypothetical protein [Lewinellaceae bacterium]MCB9267844.1 hypothetical protein [Lewinellaceae bacterium]MCB9290211.1 hypothetical protein [Lewinellaceae bacterium]